MDMRLIGRGCTAEVYEYAPRLVCKLFVSGYPEFAVRRECANAELCAAKGLPVPSCGGMIRIGERNGIIYGRVEGRSLLDMLLAGECDGARCVGTLARLHGSFLSCRLTDAEAQTTRTYKDYLLALPRVAGSPAAGEIAALPDGHVLCHGDFHPGNIMTGGGDETVIDFMNVCRAPALYDVARTFFLLSGGELPPGADEAAIHAMRTALAAGYLKAMGADELELAPYLSVIRQTREAEMGR